MEIRFISSLTPEDEALLASVICDAAGRLLSAVPLAYTMRIVTGDGKVFQQQSTHAGTETRSADDESRRAV